MVRFYTDEHISRAVIKGLRNRGVDVLAAHEADNLEAADEVHLERAWQEGRVLFTQDADFLRLHSSGLPHAGIAYAPQNSSTGNLIRGLMLIYDLLDPEEMEGRIEFI